MSIKRNSIRDTVHAWCISTMKMTHEGAAGFLGNLYSESSVNPECVEELLCQRYSEDGDKTYKRPVNTAENIMYNNELYTKRVDNGTYPKSEFITPRGGKHYGYGLIQSTTVSRKQLLWEHTIGKGKSIGNLSGQLEYLENEFKSLFPKTLAFLQKTKNIDEASDYVLIHYEAPNNAISMKSIRRDYSRQFYELYKEDKSMGVIESAVEWMEEHANNPAHGYDQIYRWGERGDYDCSAAVITAYQQAGVPVKSKGATYTGNMLEVFLKCGFKDITSSVNRATGAGLQRGDVLLCTSHHVALYCGNGREVEASINEKGTATYGRPGDQTGREFLIRPYRNYPWSNILRYVGANAGEVKAFANVLVKGTNSEAVRDMQNKLNAIGYNCGVVDGSFGDNTFKALVAFQKAYGLIVDGEFGSQSSAKLNDAYKARTTEKLTVEQVVNDVIYGKYGNGDERKNAIKKLGLDYSTVQAKVNELLKKTTVSKKSVTEVAKEVITGKWGNGNERKKRLTQAGYDYNAVQTRVNQLL